MNNQEYSGFGSIENLRDILFREGAKNIFLATGKKSFALSGAEEYFSNLSQDFNFTKFSDFSPNPKLEEIEKGTGLFIEKDYDFLVAVGGGSVIDVAKAIKLFSFQQTQNKLPLIAIPTTAGSGSEATYFIVYYIGKEKQSEGKLELTLPEYVILDPELTMSLPKKITADTGMDALSQAVESHWSIHSTTESKKYAKESIVLTINNLEKAVNSPSKNSREKMLKAANLAGKAINISKTTSCHSLAYPMTSHFNISHGHAAGLTLGEMLKFNYGVSEKDCLDKRGFLYVKKIISEISECFGYKNPKEAGNKIYSLMERIGIENKFSQLGLGEKDRRIIIKNGFNPERMKNNPRKLTKESVKKILNNRY